MSRRGSKGLVGKLRWFHPSYHDTSIFLWLFLLGTGWNLGTALALDVSNDDWFSDHMLNKDFKVIEANKARAGRKQFALCREKTPFHPYQVVRFMIERTAVLRETVRQELRDARRRALDDDSSDLAQLVADLDETAKSPWLYHVLNKAGSVSRLHHHDSMHLNDFIRLVAERHGLVGDEFLQMVTSDARDNWIGQIYEQSGYDVILTQLAAQHKTPKTLKNYLARKRYRTFSEGRIRLVQDKALAEIEEKEILDPTRLSMLVREGTITPEQEKRLLDHRQRTKVGMGCKDQRNPPKKIAPYHPEGTLCAVQRCTGCKHGVVFDDSYPALARRLAELRFRERTMPQAAWIGSSFEDEADSIDATLKKFGAVDVLSLVAEWTDKFNNGEAFVNDVFPSY